MWIMSELCFFLFVLYFMIRSIPFCFHFLTFSWTEVHNSIQILHLCFVLLMCFFFPSSPTNCFFSHFIRFIFFVLENEFGIQVNARFKSQLIAIQMTVKKWQKKIKHTNQSVAYTKFAWTKNILSLVKFCRSLHSSFLFISYIDSFFHFISHLLHFYC